MTTTQPTSPTATGHDLNLMTLRPANDLADLEILTMTRQSSSSRGPLFTQHAALVLLVALIGGAVIGVLTFLATPVLATAVLAGICGTAATALGCHQLIE